MNPSILVLSLLTLSGANYDSLKFLTKFYSQCTNKTDVFKCLKVQSLKIMDRALHSKAINIVDGVTLIGDRRSRDLLVLNSTQLEGLSSEEVDQQLGEATSRFLNTHKFEVNVPKLVEQARKKGGRGGWGALLWALAIKGSFLAMAYQGIAVMSATAILVGKMVLLLSAILGLKKLVSSGNENTTFEIVKIPKHSESHSMSFEDYGHHHRRAFDVFGRRIEHRQV